MLSISIVRRAVGSLIIILNGRSIAFYSGHPRKSDFEKHFIVDTHAYLILCDLGHPYKLGFEW